MDSSAEAPMKTSSNDNNNEIDDEQQCAYASQLVTMSVLPMVLQTAIELNLLEIIAKSGHGGRMSPSEIVAHLPTQNPDASIMLDRMLGLLATYSILTCYVVDDQRSYGLAPVCKYLVRNEDGVSLGPLMSLIQDKVFMDSWHKLKEAVLEGGIPFNKAHGMHAFEYPGKDPRFNQVFNTAMYNHTTITIKKVIESYKGFEHLKHKQVVDVGGGVGVTLSLITSKYPSIKGVNFDLPHVVQHAQHYPGVEHVGGDMFESIPKGDAIFMKWILHDWSDDQCLKLLKNCYKALPEDGKVIVVEALYSVMPDSRAATRWVRQADLVMMTQNPGGKERTQNEFMALAIGAGFSGIKYECFVCNFWVMEFFK